MSVEITFGKSLASAREKLNFSEKDMASRLNLNFKIIHALETEDFSDSLPPTFMRGYLRSYAQMLDFSSEDINLFTKQLEIKLPSATPVTTSPNLRPLPVHTGHRYVRWLTYGIAFSMIALVSLWWNAHSNYPVADIATNNKTIEIASPATTAEVTTTAAPAEQPPAIAQNKVSTDTAESVQEDGDDDSSDNNKNNKTDTH